MSQGNGSSEQPQKIPSQNWIARAIFATAESMGIFDRGQIEQLTGLVIARLGQPQPLPGMEHLVPPAPRKQHQPTDAEIRDIVREILASESPGEKSVPSEPVPTTPTEKEEVPPKMEVAMKAPTKSQPASGIKLTENALHVLEKRYLKKDEKGKVVETPEEMFRRVARTIASAELLYGSKADVRAREKEFHQLMTSLDFLPNSPTLMNAGRELGQLSACFVLPVEDSMESIFNAVKYTALIHKSGGGTGFSFSRLRAEKSRVGSTGGVASGPVSFMRAFDTATDVIKQGGMRRGANMAILNIDHPDILRFITAKEDPRAFTNFNLSVAVTAGFMEALKAGREYDLVDPHTKETVGQLNAKEVFDKIVDSAWRTGDPGVVFIDRINQFNPTPHLGKIESTNPCGEQPLLPYESCNLGSVNLARLVKRDNGTAKVDYAKLGRMVRLAVRFLDNVIDVNRFPLPEIEEMTKKTRKIGLGVMGFADMLLQLGIPYNSEEAVTTAENVMRFISEEARQASVALGEERGVFPTFAGSVYDVPSGLRPRNASCTTIAPTGTLSIIAACSSGIEPLFALSYTRNILDGAHLVEVNPFFEEAARQGGFYSEELIKKLAEGAHLSEMEGIPEKVKRVFVTAHEITPEWHVRMQAAFQRHTDNAVSKTVNFPQSATREDVAKVYLMSYEQGLKGITIYRDKSRESQVLVTGKESLEKTATPEKLRPRKRPEQTHGYTRRVSTGCGHMYVTVNSDERGICEVFSSLGKSGGCASAQLEATCRLISLALRSGVEADSVVKQLRGIRCPSIAWGEGKAVLSCADAIASVLEKHINGEENGGAVATATPVKEAGKAPEDYGLAKNLAGQCPDCASILIYQEGCFHCPGCGYTKC